jgi:RNase P subunit RPR2
MTRCNDCGAPLLDGGHELIITDDETHEVLVSGYWLCDDCEWETA